MKQEAGRMRRTAAAVGRGLRAVGRGVGALRTLMLNLAFAAGLLVAVAVAVAVWHGQRVTPLESGTTLVVELKGALREQSGEDPSRAALGRLQGTGRSGPTLHDLRLALRAAARDPQIDRVLLRLDEFGGAGLVTLREVASEITRLREAGKQVVAWGAGFDQRSYYLAAHADAVWMHPMGEVRLEGLGRQRNYYRDALDRLGVQANVIRAGRYKNAGEPYFASGPSTDTLESEAFVLDALWLGYTADVEKARGLAAGAVDRMIQALPGSLERLEGDEARLALQERLVDALLTPDELQRALAERTDPKTLAARASTPASGASDASDVSTQAVAASDLADLAQARKWPQIALRDYLKRQAATAERAAAGPRVAVVVAEGEIVDGQAGPGRIGGESTSALIRAAREDEQVKAVVLRVNSPGGSAYASELIRRELELTRAAGKPVVVSMGDVAASGGYWIALAADEVVAAPSTVTGSIGVFTLMPTAAGLMDKVGVKTGGYGTTWLAGAYDLRRPLDPRVAQMAQASVSRIYADFIGRAARARATSPERIDAVAQGRIWTGGQAAGHGLVDRTGTLDDALQVARKRAELPDDAPLKFMEKSAPSWVRVLQRFGVWDGVQAGVAEVVQAVWGASVPAPAWMGVAGPLLGADGGAALDELVWVADLVQGRRTWAPLAHCLCRVMP